MDVTAYHPCHHCGRAFADHNYVKDSIDKYLCPVLMHDIHYGYAQSTNFMPDPEYGEASTIGVSVIEYQTCFEPVSLEDGPWRI